MSSNAVETVPAPSSVTLHRFPPSYAPIPSTNHADPYDPSLSLSQSEPHQRETGNMAYDPHRSQTTNAETDTASVYSTDTAVATPRPPKTASLDDLGRPTPSFHRDRVSSIAESTNSRMSLYEFSQPKRDIINADAVSKYDYPIFLLSLSVFTLSVLYFVFGGTKLLSRSDVKRHMVNNVAIGAAAISFPFTLIVAAIALERKVHEFKQLRKHIKKSRSSWTKPLILLFAGFLSVVVAILWSIGGIGMVVVHMNYEPYNHRNLRHKAGWVGGQKDWKAGEKLGTAVFTSEGGVLQAPVIIALLSSILSIVLAILQIVQVIVSKPKPSPSY